LLEYRNTGKVQQSAAVQASSVTAGLRGTEKG